MTDLLKDTGLPAVAAAVVVKGKIKGAGAVGVRKAGDPTLVTINDQFHIGSGTKSMTATLAAILVEEKRLTWDTKVSDVFKDIEIHPEAQNVTLLQLLSHNAGCPRIVGGSQLWNGFIESTDPGQVQRYDLARAKLAMKPEFPPGTGYAYSNTGFAVAGAMMEVTEGKPWEDLLKEKVFEPLGMSTAGFGAPPSSLEGPPSQPWGHESQPVPPTPHGDNPAAIGPAGAVHCSILDWARYAQFHLGIDRTRLLKKGRSLTVLHTVQNPKGSYGLGWQVSNHPAAGLVLSHGGTNRKWYSRIWLAPDKKFAVVVACNSGSGKAAALCNNVINRFGTKYGILPEKKAP
ncbi:MAG: beta-lactamase family protein [Verrucomicrobiae bacterium]|nr:beta-lactamase family protein [Verrucomicrobiae bacterium]